METRTDRQRTDQCKDLGFRLIVEKESLFWKLESCKYANFQDRKNLCLGYLHIIIKCDLVSLLLILSKCGRNIMSFYYCHLSMSYQKILVAQRWFFANRLLPISNSLYLEDQRILNSVFAVKLYSLMSIFIVSSFLLNANPVGCTKEYFSLKLTV